MTEPEHWAEMVLRRELESLEKDHSTIVKSNKGGLNIENEKAIRRVSDCMINCEDVLEIIGKFNLNLNRKK